MSLLTAELSERWPRPGRPREERDRPLDDAGRCGGRRRTPAPTTAPRPRRATRPSSRRAACGGGRGRLRASRHRRAGATPPRPAARSSCAATRTSATPNAIACSPAASRSARSTRELGRRAGAASSTPAAPGRRRSLREVRRSPRPAHRADRNCCAGRRMYGRRRGGPIDLIAPDETAFRSTLTPAQLQIDARPAEVDARRLRPRRAGRAPGHPRDPRQAARRGQHPRDRLREHPRRAT